MKRIIRVVLVDPNDESRHVLQRLLSGISSVWIAEVCATYEAAARSVTEHAPDLTLIGLDADPEQALGQIQALLRAHPQALVLPASKLRDGDLILRAFRAGAREFLPLPAQLDELLAAIDRLIPTESASGAATRLGSQIIAITGAAGGVGCTTLAVNLAATLAHDPERTVVLADFDLLFGSVDACLDIIPDQTLLEVAQSVDRLDLTLLKRSLTRHTSGLYVLPHPIAMEDVPKIDPEALRRVLGMLRAAFDLVVIDTSKALQASDFTAFEMADTILLVTQLDLTCLRNSARLVQLFRQIEGLTDRVRVVANRVGGMGTEIGLKKAEEALNTTIRWQIPNAFKEINTARAKGVTIDVVAPGCRAHRVIQEIAREFLPAADARPKNRLGRFAALF
jgi:pilus assembly protein CpaE